MVDIVKRIEELMDLFDEGEVTTADRIQSPQSALDRQMFEDFKKRNPMAYGGRTGFFKGKLVKTGLRKGQVVFLHSNVVHGSETNDSDRFRKAFLCGYLKWGSNFATGGHMKRKPIDVGSAKLSQLSLDL